MESCMAIVDAIASFERTMQMITELSLNQNYRMLLLFCIISEAHEVSRN